MHLAPLPLVMMVLLCSGALWVLSFRDVMATGRSIAGGMDDAMLVSWLAARSIDRVGNFAVSVSGALSRRTVLFD